MPYQARELAFGLGLEGTNEKPPSFSWIVSSVVSTDASLAEINPLVVTEDDQVIALDAV